jgi:hypothetical protein
MHAAWDRTKKLNMMAQNFSIQRQFARTGIADKSIARHRNGWR